MKWSSGVSESPSLETAFEECYAKIKSELDGDPNLVMAFAGVDYANSYSTIPRLVSKKFPTATFIGCSGNGIIGDGREIENRPGFSLTAASLPAVKITPFHVTDEDLPDGDDPPHKWEEILGVKSSDRPEFIILADPFSMRSQNLVKGLDYAFPGSTIIGGIASGGRQPEEKPLFFEKKDTLNGVVGVALSGNIQIDTIVAQGCKPIGELMRITRCRRNILEEINGQRPFDALGDIYMNLPEEDQKLFQHSLFLGVVMDPFNEDPAMGDFLIRNVLGADQEKGVVAIGELLQEGQIVQFHLRDSRTSADNLNDMLNSYPNEISEDDGAGALLFSCLGRGSYLYEKPDHDTDLFREKIGNIPLTGFFCNGEIGPVGGTTHIHGYTSAFGVIKSRPNCDG